MKIHHIRNATLVIETKTNVILVDPMLGDKGTQLPFSLFRFKARKNPIVPLPENCNSILEKVTHCLITHQHPDHIDKEAEQYLIRKNTPVTCSIKDAKAFTKKGLNVIGSVVYWKKSDFLEGSITGVPARHGYGFVASLMGNVMGYFIELPHVPSVYISADTVYTEAVDKALKEFQPSLSLVAAGTAQLDIGQPLMMRVDDVVKFVKNSPNKVLANHLEAVNHCPTTREGLKQRLVDEGLDHKVFIPDDGDVVDIS